MIVNKAPQVTTKRNAREVKWRFRPIIIVTIELFFCKDSSLRSVLMIVLNTCLVVTLKMFLVVNVIVSS